jgi:hypothetical protein
MADNDNQSNHKPGVNITIGGNVGPASAIGEDIRVTAQNVAGGNIINKGANINSTDQENFLKLIQELQTQISQLESQFDSDDAEDIQDRLEKVAQLSTREKPPAERIKRDLETVCEIVKDTAVTGAAVAPILPLVHQALEMFLHMFGI